MSEKMVSFSEAHSDLFDKYTLDTLYNNNTEGLTVTQGIRPLPQFKMAVHKCPNERN